MTNSLLAANLATNGADCAGTLHSLGYNFLERAAGSTLSPALGDQGDRSAYLWPSLVPVDPSTLLGPSYHPFLHTGPAIDAGNPAGCTDDQGQPLLTDMRGNPRWGRCDLNT